MADLKDDQRGDPHNWNPLDNYIYLHEMHLENHPYVLMEESSLDFTPVLQPQAPHDMLVVRGFIVFENGLNLEIRKTGALDKSRNRRVRMSIYSYNAWFPGRHNVLRYDNMHLDEENIYHRHLFDPSTGEEIIKDTLTRSQFPVMHEILNELMQMFCLN